MQAECEGLCGRAWQSMAAKKRREVKYRNASTAFEALYGQPEDDNNEQEDDTDGEDCSSEGVSISDCEGEVITFTVQGREKDGRKLATQT